MDNLTFGIPKKQKKEKSWDFHSEKPVIKIEKDRGLRKPKGVYLNKKAHDLLFGESNNVKKLGIDFGLSDNIVKFANVNNLDVEFNNITKNPPYKFSNSTVYKYLCNSLNIVTSIDNFFELSMLDTPLIVSAKLIPLNSNISVVPELSIELKTENVSEITDLNELSTTELPTILQGIDAASW